MPNNREKRRGESLKQALVAMCMEEKQISEKEFNEYFRKCKRWYDLYRGIYTQNYHGFRNNISIPFLYSVVQSDVARKAQMSFGTFPYVSFEGYAPEDEPIAKKNELLISVQFEDCSMYRKAVDFFTCTDLYGVGIMRDGWRHDVRNEKIRVPNYVAPGVIEDMEVDHPVTYFNGPDAEVIDPLDFRPQPGFRYIDEMDWCGYEYYRDLDHLMDMVRNEEAEGEEPSYDMAALREVEKQGMGTGTETAWYERQGYARNMQEYGREQRYRKPVKIYERWGYVPSELAPDGVRCRRIVIFNDKILGRNSPNPYHHGQKPFTSFSIGDPHHFHGVGKSELLAKMQAASNRLLNHKLDSLDLSISPAMIVGAGSGLDSSRPLHMTPGKIIQLDTNEVGDNFIRPWSPDMTGIQMVAPEIETMWRYMQQGSGIIEDTVSGSGGNVEQTAREFQGRQEAVMTRLMLESRIAEEVWLEPLANRFRALNRQFLPVPQQIRMIGSMAVKDPITGMPLPPEDLSMNYEDLWPDYKARATGANQNMLRSAQQQNVIQLLQAASSNPALMQMVNWGNFARQMFTTFGFRDINSLLIDLPVVQEANDMYQSEMGMGGAAVGAPENLNPNSTPPLQPLE